MNKLYHFYFDEGGMFNNACYSIEPRKINKNRQIFHDDLYNYYYGKLSINAIARHLQLFHKAFPKCIILHHGSQDFSTSELLTIQGM